MTIAVVTLSVALAIAVGGLIAMGVALQSSLASERASMAVEGIASRQQLLAERDRDQAIARAVQAEAERDHAQFQLAATQTAAVVAAKEKVDHVRTEVAAGTASAAVDVLSDILSTKLPGSVPATADADGADSRTGHAEPATVSAAAARGADEVHRLPKP